MFKWKATNVFWIETGSEMSGKIFKRIVFAIIMLILITGIVGLNFFRMLHVPDSELPGKYQGMHGRGEDVIEIRSDGTYQHLYREKTSDELMVNDGSWVRDSNGGITFANYRDFSNLYGGEIGRDLMDSHFDSVGVSKPFFSKTIRLGFSSEITNYYYEKID